MVEPEGGLRQVFCMWGAAESSGYSAVKSTEQGSVHHHMANETILTTVFIINTISFDFCN